VPQPATEAAVPAGAAAAGASGALPTYGPATSKVFNPDIAVIGNFLGVAGDTTASDVPTLVLDEAEASFQAVVDPYARADFFFAFNPEGVEIEEGYLTFPTLPGGLLAKLGKKKAAFGKANSFHNHNRPWADQPLVNRNLLGGDEGFADSGVSLAWLIPNDLIFLEATGEVLSGSSEIFAAPERKDLTYVGRLRAYRDLTESTNLDLGGSIAYGTNGLTQHSKTRLIGTDLAFRWRPLRRARYRSFIARTELVWSRREAEASVQSAFGFYASAEYQIARRWFAGLRYDLSDRADDASIRDEGISALVTFWPSEFSQIRAQYRRTVYGDQDCSNELLLQFLFSIGAHGAHPF